MPVSSPLVVAMAKSDLVPKYDLSSIRMIACGGAPLGKEVAKSFSVRFPQVDIVQVFQTVCINNIGDATFSQFTIEPPGIKL
ncbi:putative 4-coumarate--CoA ligase [Helianthus anomalus]